MIERQKMIDASMWTNLMKPNWSEVLGVVLESEKEKAAGYDGVSIDLIRLLTEDSNKEKEPTPLLSLLTTFINISLG